MAGYKRKSGYSNGYSKRGRFTARPKKRYTAKSSAKNFVLKLREQKMSAFAITPNTIPTTVSINQTHRSFRIAQGDTHTTRDGNEVYATGFYFKAQIRANTDSPNKAYVRCLMVTPRQDSDDVPLTPTMTSIIDTDKFIVHKDFVVSVTNDAATPSGSVYQGYDDRTSKFVVLKKKWKTPVKIIYSGVTSTPRTATPVVLFVSSTSLTVGGSPSGLVPSVIEGNFVNYFKDR